MYKPTFVFRVVVWRRECITPMAWLLVFPDSCGWRCSSGHDNPLIVRSILHTTRCSCTSFIFSGREPDRSRGRVLRRRRIYGAQPREHLDGPLERYSLGRNAVFELIPIVQTRELSRRTTPFLRMPYCDALAVDVGLIFFSSTLAPVPPTPPTLHQRSRSCSGLACTASRVWAW